MKYYCQLHELKYQKYHCLTHLKEYYFVLYNTE